MNDYLKGILQMDGKTDIARVRVSAARRSARADGEKRASAERREFRPAEAARGLMRSS